MNRPWLPSMDAAAMTGVIDTSLNLGPVGFSRGYDDAALVRYGNQSKFDVNCFYNDQREDPDRVVNGGVNGGESAKKKSEVSVREFERVVSEKKELETLLIFLSGKYDSLVDRFSDQRDEAFLQEHRDGAFGKRKVDYCSDQESWKRPRENNRCRVHKVYYQVDASNISLVVKDGYQWRKYGQKVTRDNPFPRAYFKCSFSPSCPVKKKVQRSVDNLTILVATYEGEHNHQSPSQAATSSLRPDSLASFHSTPSSPTAASLVTQQTKVEVLPKVLIQQMATSLTRDPAFTSVIAEAISGTVMNQMLARTDRDRSPRRELTGDVMKM